MAVKTVVLITTGQPSTNPRLVKEADALTKSGYQVTVLYCFWSQWAAAADEELLAAKSARFVLVGGEPRTRRWLYWWTRIRAKMARKLSDTFGTRWLLAEYARCRCYPELLAQARANRADLYIAHTLGALPVAVNAARHHRAKAGFDAEDFHRAETANLPEKALKQILYLEDTYLSQVDYLTAASPLIGKAYGSLYPGLRPVIINNVFSTEQQLPAVLRLDEKALKLFWFSQTVGPNRGIEEAIHAIGITQKRDIRLYLLGSCRPAVRADLEELATRRGLQRDQLIFLPTVAPDRIVRIAAQFDVGLALEPAFSINNDLALSNKLFTYLLAGNAVIASNTRGQAAFMQQYPAIGKTYNIGDVPAFAAHIQYFYANREALNGCRKQAWELGSKELNWEKERDRFLRVVEGVLGSVPVESSGNQG